MAAPVVNPPTPFTTLIPGGFFPGAMIRIRGMTPMHGQRFDINLQTGAGGEIAGEDVALHASVRLIDQYIARNSFQGGCWQEELGDGGMPIQMGQRFEFLILCEAHDYKIAVNGQHFCSFPPRIPYHRITHLLIEGDVQLEMISWEGSGASAPPMNEPPKYGEAVAPPQYTPHQTFIQQSAPMPPPGASHIPMPSLPHSALSYGPGEGLYPSLEPHFNSGPGIHPPQPGLHPPLPSGIAGSHPCSGGLTPPHVAVEMPLPHVPAGVSVSFPSPNHLDSSHDSFPMHPASHQGDGAHSPFPDAHRYLSKKDLKKISKAEYKMEKEIHKAQKKADKKAYKAQKKAMKKQGICYYCKRSRPCSCSSSSSSSD